MKKTLTIVLASASLLAGGAAIAQPMGGDTGPTTRADLVQKTAERFARMDANGDGRLDATDREARKAERFVRADTDGDGALSQAEIEAAKEARKSARAERRGARGDGERMERRGGKRGQRGMAMMQRADTDGDGAISQAEFQAAALARFDRADADGNGTVTAEERKAAREAHRAERRAARAAS